LDQAPPKPYEIISEWNNWFIDLQKAQSQEKKAPVVTQMQTYKDEVSQEQFFKPRLFTYPDFSKSNTVFDQDDLEQENVMFLLCVRKQPEIDIE
jgi:hypothetical protein